MIALQALDATNAALGATQKQVSTGYRVADSTDDGAAYAIAQNVRSSVGALTSANQQLGNVGGLLTTAQSGLNNISNTMASMRDVLVKLSDGDVQGSDRTNYAAQYTSMLANVKTFITDSTYNGKTLLDNTSTTAGQATGGNTYGSLNVARNESGGQYTVQAVGMCKVYASIAAALTTDTSTAIAALLTTHGTFVNNQNTVGNDLNTVGSTINYVTNQVSYNSNKIDSLNTGLGSLVDADLATESASLQSLQIRQQLGAQALTLANQAPQTLLSLFK
jgi:flagellin